MGRPKKEKVLSNAERKRKWRENNHIEENKKAREKRKAKKEEMTNEELEISRIKEKERKAKYRYL